MKEYCHEAMDHSNLECSILGCQAIDRFAQGRITSIDRPIGSRNLHSKKIAQFHGRSARQTEPAEPASFVPPRHQLWKPSHLLRKSAGQLNGELELSYSYTFFSSMMNPFE